MKKVYPNAKSLRLSVPKQKTVVLVGGSFDLLHVGHLRLFEYSKKFADLLVVCVLSDENIRSYKGTTRPIIKEEYRAKMVAALECVDRVYISDVGTSHEDTLSVIRPNSVVYGIEETDHWKVKAAEREKRLKTYSANVRVHYLGRFPDATISTSGIILRILDSYTKR